MLMNNPKNMEKFRPKTPQKKLWKFSIEMGVKL